LASHFSVSVTPSEEQPQNLICSKELRYLRAESAAAGLSAPVNRCSTALPQQPRQCGVLPFLMDYGNAPAGMSQPRVPGLKLGLLSKPPET